MLMALNMHDGSEGVNGVFREPGVMTTTTERAVYPPRPGTTRTGLYDGSLNEPSYHMCGRPGRSYIKAHNQRSSAGSSAS